MIMPENLWRAIYESTTLTIKGIISTGWRFKDRKEAAVLKELFFDHDNNKLHDILCLANVKNKKRTHVKFVGRESDIASRIYEEHLRLNTTISNYLLYLLIQGLYLYNLTECSQQSNKTELDRCICCLISLLRDAISNRLLFERDSFYKRIVKVIHDTVGISSSSYEELPLNLNKDVDIVTLSNSIVRSMFLLKVDLKDSRMFKTTF